MSLPSWLFNFANKRRKATWNTEVILQPLRSKIRMCYNVHMNKSADCNFVVD